MERYDPSEFEMIAGTRAVLELLAGKWTVEVLYLLASGRRRYSEIYYEVGEVSKKVLRVGCGSWSGRVSSSARSAARRRHTWSTR
jgi:hypothetical protein